MATTPINNRPGLPQVQTPQPASNARAAAQRAFFDAALAKANAPAAPTAPARTIAPTAAAPAQTEARAVQPAVTRLKDETVVPPHPGRILRPGSLIDIKV